jgi:hypothetical protein
VIHKNWAQICAWAVSCKSVNTLVLVFLLVCFFLSLGFAAPAGAQAYPDSSSPAQNTSGSQAPSSGPAPADELRPSYPGEPFNSPPVEATVGPARLRVYGTILFNASFSDTAEVGEEVPLWPLPSSSTVSFPDGTTKPAGKVHDTIFTARQSIVGVVLNPAQTPASGWKPAALVEIDFFGTRPVDTNIPQSRVLNQPRLRVAYFQLEKGDFKLVAGQDKIIISPLDPVSLSHVAVPLGFAAGDLFGWLPQVRVDYTHKFASTTALFQFGVLRPSFSDPRLASSGTQTNTGDLPAVGTSLDGSPGLGERASQPFYQARVAVSHPFRGSTTTVGVGAHYGKERLGAVQEANSWAFAIDLRVPIERHLIFRGEAYMGSNLIPFGGGVLQGVATVPTAASAPPAPPFTQFRKIGDGGGWGEFTIPVTPRNVFYLGASTDDPVNKDLLPSSTRQKNSFVWASYFRKLTREITLGAEWSNWQFHTLAFVGNTPAGRSPNYGRGNVVNIALAYQF